MSTYTRKEITSPLDPLLPAWLELYELSFPPNERVLVSKIMATVQALPDGEHHCSAWVDETGALLGLAFWQEVPSTGAAYLWYFAVQPGLRSQGLGGQFYDDLARAVHARYPLLMYEVEIPEETSDPVQRQLRRRRLAFYHRHGARRLGGVDYMQTVGSHLPPTPLHLLGHGRAGDGLRPQTLFDAAKVRFGDLLRQTGPLEWIEDEA